MLLTAEARELDQAQVATLSLMPSGSMNAEDVGDLQGGVPHDRRTADSRRGQRLQWVDLVAQQHLNHADTFCSSR